MQIGLAVHFGLAVLVGLGLLLTLPISADPGQALRAADDWLYVLQPDGAADIAAIQASSFDVVVIDYSSTGDVSGEFTAPQIAALKASGKVVLSYLSIGEAEDFRWYWDAAWNDDAAPDPDAPAWLGPFNPAFPDNYKVRYWDAAWQGILFGTTSGPQTSYLDRIVDQGFDGIYLDIIDAFYFWSEVEVERTRAQARQDMISLVQALANHARVIRGVPDFLIVPQNGEDIIWDDDDLLDVMGQGYLAAIEAIGVEDVFYDELSAQPAMDVTYRTELLDDYLAAGVVVLSTDYVWNAGNPTGASNITRYNDYQTQTLSRGYVPYAAVRDRDLNEILEIDAVGGLNEPQPKAGGATVFADGFESGSTSAWSSGR